MTMCAALCAHHLDDAVRLELVLVEQSRVLGGRDQAQAGEQGDHVDGEGHVERIAPAPVEEVVRLESSSRGRRTGRWR